MHYHGNWQEFIGWFVSPNTTDGVESKKAISSLRDEDWWEVWPKLEDALCAEEFQAGNVGDPVNFPAPQEECNYDLVIKKQEILTCRESGPGVKAVPVNGNGRNEHLAKGS